MHFFSCFCDNICEKCMQHDKLKKIFTILFSEKQLYYMECI